jgi:hypothetical protein
VVGSKQIEFMASGFGVGACVEVKSADDLDGCLRKAAEQFEPGTPNILAIASRHRMIPVASHRDQLTRALIGQDLIVLTSNKVTGEVRWARRELVLDGPLTRPMPPVGAPNFTRVSAVVCIEPSALETADPWESQEQDYRHNILVLPNPYASDKLPDEYWSDCPRLIWDDEKAYWSDH